MTRTGAATIAAVGLYAAWKINAAVLRMAYAEGKKAGYAAALDDMLGAVRKETTARDAEPAS